MTDNAIIKKLKFFFPRTFGNVGSGFSSNPDGLLILNRIQTIGTEPLRLTHFNQLLHLMHEAGVSEGFFRYYFLSAPSAHPYPVSKLQVPEPNLDATGIASIEQAEWGLLRFFTDALIYWGDIRTAYRALRVMTHEQLEAFFRSKRFPTDRMRQRGRILPMQSIPMDDRYLISEIATKAYAPGSGSGAVQVEDVLLSAFRAAGGKRTKIGTLFGEGSRIEREEPEKQLMLQLAAEEFMDDEVEDEREIREKVASIKKRFVPAQEAAHQNTRLYLSFVNELDVYVATSMRRRDDFRNMAKDCDHIFKNEHLRDLNLRYFDPTISAAKSHEDKGLIECLMVKCSKAVLYFAGERDSFGKDAEIAMAMSLGKPVVILCPDTPKGKQREEFFRDVHPLSRLIEFDTGIAIGAMVTRDRDVAAELLRRVFSNEMQYKFEQEGDGYFRLREQLTSTVVRLQTNWQILREAFWNYYHGAP